ncbi:MAG: hypothetical protein HY741_18890 [Chloroflexi bacterium]|nr:hypothetical protein [Chloroflexota bacterium]MBI4761733.1 hypothetical protein [Chloroflexota bacterium]
MLHKSFLAILRRFEIAVSKRVTAKNKKNNSSPCVSRFSFLALSFLALAFLALSFLALVFLALSFLVLSFLAFLPPPLHAQTPAPNILVTLAPLDRKTPVELSALTVDADILESAGRTFANGALTWKVHNTDTLNDATILVGFPSQASASATFDPTQFSAFRMLVDNKPVVLAPGTADIVYGDAARTVNWYTFELTLKPDEKKELVAEFSQDLGDDLFPRFTYGMLVGNRWKNAVGSARITVNFPVETTGEQFITLDPSVPAFDGKKMTWLWQNLNPEADPGVTFIRPSLWQTLLEKRAAAAQKPDDANARLELGRVYQTLASQASPRRDNFLAQAVAELETAARLAPDNADATLVTTSKTLALLYEQRAGAATGPRDVNYISLAMAQWQKLIGTAADADARKQLAEDSFYLALDAHTRGEYEREQKLLDDARNFSPDGAGPLYTRERLENQIKQMHLAAARADIRAGAISNALRRVRAVYGDSFQPATNMPANALALNHARVKTTGNQREIVLQLLPYPAPSDAIREETTQVVTMLNQTRAGQARLDADANGYTLTITIPFSGDADLRNRLVKLAAALPARSDWALVRAALVPAVLEFSTGADPFAQRVHYLEKVDLGNGQAAIQNTLNEMSATIGELSRASADDQEAQLKLALLNHAQQWWFNALGALTLEYELDAGSGAARTWTISLSTPRTLAYDTQVIRGEWYMVGAVAAVGVILLIVLALAFLTRRQKN